MRRSLATVLVLSLFGCARDTAPTVPIAAFLSAETANHLNPSLSPDGKRMAWWQVSEGGYQLWLADGDMANATAQSIQSISSGAAAWSADGTRLAATRTVPGGTEIVVMPAAGGEPEVAYSGAIITIPVSWNAEGTRLTLLETYQGGSYRTVVVDPATRVAQALIPGETRPHIGTFAPVGSHLLVMLLDRGRYTLAVIDSLGAAPRPLTTEGYERPSGQRPWSPDGREVLYVSTRTGAEDLWLIDVESGAKRQLTNDLRRDYGGIWSADGKWVAFQSERGRQADLWVVAASGGEARRVTDTPELENLVGWRGSEMALAYTVASGTGSVQAVPVAGGDGRQLTPDSITVDYFELSPDRSQAVVTDFRGGSDLDIYLMPASGGSPRLLASVQASGSRVLWSPDGKQLAFVGVAGGTLDPWIVDVATGASRQLLDWDTRENTVIWGSDASALFVVSDRAAEFGDVWRVPLDGSAPIRVTTSGRVVNVVATLDGGTRLVVALLGGAGGRLGLGEVMPDGALREIPVAANVNGVAWNTPAGRDSLAVRVDGGLRSMMVSRRDGGGRPLGGDGARVDYWSSDGKWLTFSVASGAGRDVGVLDVATGERRRLTNGGGSNGGAEFSAAGDTVFFRRSLPVRRVAVADLTKLLGVKR